MKMNQHNSFSICKTVEWFYLFKLLVLLELELVWDVSCRICLNVPQKRLFLHTARTFFTDRLCHINSSLHVMASPVGLTVNDFPSASTQKQREPTHCSGRKSPAFEHAGMWISALAARFDFTFSAIILSVSQRVGQRGLRPVVRDPATSWPWGSTHQHCALWHWTSSKPPLAVQLGI